MLRRRVWILSASLLVWTGCKTELDDTPAADPLDDPWVDAIADEEPTTAVAIAPAAPTDPTAIALADPGTAVADPTALAEPGTTPPTGVVASPTSSNPSASKSNPAAPGTVPAAADPAAPIDPAAPVEPAPAVAPTPEAPAVAPAAPATPPPLTLADLAGDYRFVGGSAQRENLVAAIETAAEQLPAAIRGIGRKRLTKTNPIDDNLEIVMTGDSVQTIFETGFDAECVIDGGTVHWTSKNNDKYKVRVRAKGSKLVQIIEGEDGVKTTVFVLSADRKKLTVHHKIDADRLDEDMTYSLSYSRK
jgi:hypothetical protein